MQPNPPEQKGYGNSTTIAFDVTDPSTARLVLLGLAETVGARLRADRVQAGGISVGIKSYDLQYASHQMTLENATNMTGEIHHYACCLFEQLWDGRPIRHLGIHTSRIKEQVPVRQLDLFSFKNYEKVQRADVMVDHIRRRYGIDAVQRAAFLGNNRRIDHMSGGISREKRTVDYSRVKIG